MGWSVSKAAKDGLVWVMSSLQWVLRSDLSLEYRLPLNEVLNAKTQTGQLQGLARLWLSFSKNRADYVLYGTTTAVM